MTKMTWYTEFVSVLAPHKVALFRISLFIPINTENQTLFCGVSAILRSGLILENIRVFVKIRGHCPGSPD